MAPGTWTATCSYRPAAWPAAWRSHFGRKTHGASWLAVGPVQSEPAAASLLFSTRMAGSSERPVWKQELHDQLVLAQMTAVRSSLAAMELSLMAGPGRYWANLWKPLQPNHGPIVRLGLQHHVVGDHVLRLLFSDGTAGDVDFSAEQWTGVLAPLNDPGYFAGVTVDQEAGTIAWPDGIDLAPEPPYEQAKAHPLIAA